MHIIYMALGCLFSYLLGSFYSVSFDISMWTDAVRFLVALTGGTISVSIGVLAYLR